MKIRDFLSVESFDPYNVDISFLESVSAQIPDEGYIDANMAERLSTVTLKAADYCGDLLAQATVYLGHCDANRKSVRSKLIKQMMDNKVPSTIIGKDIYGDDPEYIAAANKHNVALAWCTWLENKHNTLIKNHHLCKDLIKKTEGSRSAAGWDSSSEESNTVLSSKIESDTPSKSKWKV